MSTDTKVSAHEHATHTAHTWINDVRFLREANISLNDVDQAAAATTAAAVRHLPPARLDKALDQLPIEIRTLLRPAR